MTTTIINLFGGAGVGKSTIAALLFARMKIAEYDVELVREYVKLWVWGGRNVRKEDQIYLLGKQSAYESMLYGKVDYIVTDSPVFLAGVYAEWYNGADGCYVTSAAKEFMRQTERGQGVVIKNYLLKRQGKFDPRGRWGTAEDAERFDRFLHKMLTENGLDCQAVEGSAEEKVKKILEGQPSSCPPPPLSVPTS